MLLLRKSRSREIIEELLRNAEININRDNPQDIIVHDKRFYDRVLSDGSLGLGESYMKKWWDCRSLDHLFDNITTYNLAEYVKENYQIKLNYLKNIIFNNRSVKNSKRVIKQHYNLGNDLYFSMLGENPLETENHAFMQYTCAYQGNTKNKEEFDLRNNQIRKLELICKKAELRDGMKILELGSGFGGFANYSSINYNIEITAYNISKNQIEFAREWNKNLPIKIIEKDYRLAEGEFDRIISIGLAEHVDSRELMKTAHRCLSKDGLFIIHTIGRLNPKKGTDPWIDKYIFPGGNLPSISQLTQSAEGLFTILDIQNFGTDYDPTLMAWNTNFQNSWTKLENNYSHLIDGKFKRMWEYYLLSCAGAFRVTKENPKALKNQLFQIVLSKSPLRKYVSVR